METHGKAKRELEASGADPAKTDTEGTADEDRWFGGRSLGWFDRLFRRGQPLIRAEVALSVRSPGSRLPHAPSRGRNSAS
jgi:hypothetical protein